MKKYLIFFAAMLLGITACDKKHKDNYPAVTSEGKNIWACKINGSPVIYKGQKGFIGAGVKASVYNTGTTVTSLILSGSGNGYEGYFDNQSIDFEQQNPELGKKYYFNSDTCFYEYSNHGIGLNPAINYAYFASYYSSGWVKFNSLSGIVSGEYELKIINVGDSTYPVSQIYDTLNITEGRFDIAH